MLKNSFFRIETALRYNFKVLIGEPDKVLGSYRSSNARENG